MTSQPEVPQTMLAGEGLDGLEADALVLPLYEEDDLADLADLDQATGGDLRRAVAAGEVRGRLFDLHVIGAARGIRRLMLAGAGRRDLLTTERVRRLAAAAGRVCVERRFGRVVWRWRGSLEAEDAVRAGVEGFVLAGFDGALYRTDASPHQPIEHVTVSVAGGETPALVRAVACGLAVGRATNIARRLCFEPSNVLTPSEFARRAAAIGGAAGLEVEVLDEERIAGLGMGLLLGVARGSVEPPRLVVLRHQPPGARLEPTLGLVGKGITFDTGGISLKSADGLERMKDDMAGGAAVIAAMHALAELQVPLRVIGVVPMTENMPDGGAVKPGDVLHSASGRTVEVINTDAEGRLVLGDALWYARQLGATHLVDVATLTGACLVALGRVAAGLFARPDGWGDAVRRAADRAGERYWPLPLFEEYGEQLKSDVADLVNSAGRPGGAITAAMFLGEFAGPGPWAHLDIAGTAWTDQPRPWQGKGASGAAVRTLVQLALEAGRWPR